MRTTDRIFITVESRELLDEGLNDAVRLLQQRATDSRGPGILVVRHEPGVYSAALSHEVPFGFTYERHE